jgi:hypothetical protein
MINTWEILTKELAINDIKLINKSYCQCYYGDRLVTIPLKNKIRLNNKKIKEDKIIFEDIWTEILELLNAKNSLPVILDEKSISLFIFSLKDLMVFVDNLLDGYYFISDKISRQTIYSTVKLSLDRDYNTFPSDTILTLPDYKITMDWIYRDACKLCYINKLLKFASLGQEKVSMIKIARGISGPWANLDLPMLERVFEWQDIEEEVRGRDKDIRKQRRYRQGLENYNEQGVGEGYYWRELRNEPYSWYDRDSESPYPGRSILTKS